MKRARTTAALFGAVMIVGLGGCADYYRYGHDGYGDRGRERCRDRDRDQDGHCMRHDDRRDGDRRDGGYNDPH